MKLNLLSKTLPAFGLNVSSSSFKIMQLEKKGTALAVKGYGSGALPKGAIVNDAISDQKVFSHLLKTAMDRMQYGRVSTNYVVASLPESKSFVRVIQIPKMGMAEAENAVPFEAESFIPLPIDQVYLDWQKLGDTEDKMNILIIAAPKEFVDKYLDILDKSGFTAVALEAESQSAQRAMVAPNSKESVLLVNIGSAKSKIIMIEEGNLQFTSTIPVAGVTFTENIARALGISSGKAEEIKKKVGISNTAEYPNITTALVPVLNNLSEEIKNIIKFHSEHSDKPVEKVVLLGGGAIMHNLDTVLASELEGSGIKSVELANPWRNLGIAAPPLDANETLKFAIAMGLAMRGVNFEI